MERVFQSQTLTDRVYAELMRRNLISDGYQWKMFCKPNYERNAMVISIYIAKQTKIEVNIEFAAISEAASMVSGKYELERYVLDKIIEELDIARQCEDLCNKYRRRDDSCIDAARYAFERMAKEAFRFTMDETGKLKMNNIEEETTMHKTQNEIEFENFANERRAQADASVQAYKVKVENEIETKRQECLEADKKDQAYQAAAQYRYFFDGLIAAGFDKDQAMAILLEKCQVTKFEMKG
jgi:hypothetical protein